MAVYRTDRERRMLGDRLVALKERFVAIDPAVAQVHVLFESAHSAMVKLNDQRLREEGEDAVARRTRDLAVAQGGKMYRWAYTQVESLMRPSWESGTTDEDIEAARARLFPLGAPAVVERSNQLILDGLQHFIEAAPRETVLSFAPSVLQAALEQRRTIEAAVAAVTREAEETAAVVREHAQVRDRWDTCYLSLRDITACFLRLNGALEQMGPLFTDLPSGPGTARTVDTPDEGSASAAPASAPGTPPAQAGPSG